ncbi:monophenol monooxygenase [Fusarium albosuccineum]|uniref:Monophenol monooxygenase n=1 Tax=Fusarium albosuccineum TaxID=1237068 RepID=A0A8H4PGW7_9HYPO|nr:monophenol monooxygenase [Fusarium albosuccineum]
MSDKPASEHYEPDHIENLKALPDGVQKETGLVLAAEGLDGQTSLKLASDGHTVLLPQPTDDPGDPLNWSSYRKHLVLFTIAWAAMCADFTGASGSSVIFDQAGEWHISPNKANQPNAINVLFNGIGGLLWVPLSSIWGRAPVLFWTTVVGLAVNIGTAVAPNYDTYFAMRVLSGLFLTSGQTIAIALLRDIFFYHERARKIGLWAALYIASPYLGPCLGNFVIYETSHWPDVDWMGVGVIGAQLILVLACIDETWYNRELPDSNQPERRNDFGSRLMRITGIWQIQHREYFQDSIPVLKKLFITITRPAFALICFAYFLCFAWAIGINISSTILFSMPKEVGGYGYSTRTIGFLYFTTFVAVFLGELFGHYFNDYMAHRYIKKHHGLYEPEVRLWTIYISIAFMVPALILVGQAFARTLHISAAIMGWGTYIFGLMLMSVSVTAYALDSYPTVPAELGGWINFARTAGGFSVGYYQEPWLELVGADASFGTQAGIVAFAVIPVELARIYGGRLRRRFVIDG